MDYPKSVPSAGLVNGRFVDENPMTGTPGSLIPADWGNGVTEEIVNVIKAGGLDPDEKKYDQLLQAIQSVSAKGWNLDLALPVGSLPLPTVANAEGRLAVTPMASSTSGGRVSIPAGVLLSLGQKMLGGGTGRSRAFSTANWSSPEMLVNSNYFLRGQVVGDMLTFYVQRGLPTDPVPLSLMGVADAAAGGGFPSTELDICLAWIQTGAPGTLPAVLTIYNRARLSWSQTLNGTGVIYLPLDPHARQARLIAANPTPSVTSQCNLSFATAGWMGSSYTFLSPGAQTVAYNQGWPSTPCLINSNNFTNDVAVSTLTASFDHSRMRSMWQVFQVQHEAGSSSGGRDELLHGMGIKGLSVTDYATGIAVNFADAVNAQLTWELIR
ncbi:phage tail protein [Pseudomonas sp. P2758]|uniref:phage tail protein n=1 Tax=unclassified Pseudomonas TaxID=196821 RepID=UPI003B5BA82A